MSPDYFSYIYGSYFVASLIFFGVSLKVILSNYKLRKKLAQLEYETQKSE